MSRFERFAFNDILEPVLRGKTHINIDKHSIVAIVEIPLTAGKTLKLYEATSRPVIKNETISMFHNDFHLIATNGTRVTALRSTDACWRDFSNNHVCPRLTEMTTNENKCLISAFVHKRMS